MANEQLLPTEQNLAETGRPLIDSEAQFRSIIFPYREQRDDVIARYLRADG